MIRLSITIFASLLSFSPVAALAQDWPAKQPIKIVVPFTAGSATDIAAASYSNRSASRSARISYLRTAAAAAQRSARRWPPKSDPRWLHALGEFHLAGGGGVHLCKTAIQRGG